MVGESIAIVASILLAFAIDAWWDGTQESLEARAVLAALRSEFAVARTELAALEQANLQILGMADSIFRIVDGVEGQADIPLRPLASLVRTPTYYPPMGELQALLQSGDLGLIDDRSLRSALAAWPAAVADLHEKSQLHVAFVYDELLPTLREMLPLAPIVDNRFPSISGPLPTDSVVTVLVDPEFGNLVQHLRLLPIRTLNAVGGLRAASSLLEVIEERLQVAGAL